jgi:hypothetical protein
MKRTFQTLSQLFWRVRYALYRRDLYRGLRSGRGSMNNPLKMSDLGPVLKALSRTGSNYVKKENL